MAKVGWDTKAEGVRLLHVAPLVYWTSYMVVLNIKSRPQLQAVIAKMERLAEEQYNRKLSPMAETSRYLLEHVNAEHALPQAILVKLWKECLCCRSTSGTTEEINCV